MLSSVMSRPVLTVQVNNGGFLSLNASFPLADQKSINSVVAVIVNHILDEDHEYDEEITEARKNGSSFCWIGDKLITFGITDGFRSLL